jgi:hypothetical protein
MWFLIQKDFGDMMLKEIKMMEGNIFSLLNVHSIDSKLIHLHICFKPSQHLPPPLHQTRISKK